MQRNKEFFETGVHKVIRVVFFDLDGTLRTSKGGHKFIKDKDDIEILPNVIDKLQELSEKGYHTIGITNQGGVAHGFKSLADLNYEAVVTQELLGHYPLNAIYQSAQDEKGTVYPYNLRTLCRKPGIGMIAHAERQAFNLGYIIDLDKSVLVGDMWSDKETANKAGLLFIPAHEFFRWEQNTFIER